MTGFIRIVIRSITLSLNYISEQFLHKFFIYSSRKHVDEHILSCTPRIRLHHPTRVDWTVSLNSRYLYGGIVLYSTYRSDRLLFILLHILIVKTEFTRYFSRQLSHSEHSNLHIIMNSYQRWICARQFGEEEVWRTILPTHTDIKNHECEICGRRFLQKGNLRTHIAGHSGIKNHGCVVCRRHFDKTKITMDDHSPTHAAIKIYVCDICGNNFTRTSTLGTRLLTHIDCKKHGCEVCGKGIIPRIEKS